MKIRHLRCYIAALLFTSTVINYVDRQNSLEPSRSAPLHGNGGLLGFRCGERLSHCTGGRDRRQAIFLRFW